MIKSWKAYLYCNGEYVDETSIDEYSYELAWDLFREFGHKIGSEPPIWSITLEEYDSTDEGEDI